MITEIILSIIALLMGFLITAAILNTRKKIVMKPKLDDTTVYIDENKKCYQYVTHRFRC